MNIQSETKMNTRMVLAGFLALIGCVVGASGQETPVDQSFVDFFLGRWDIESLSPQGVKVGRARTEVRRILENRALQSDYYALDPQGNSIFRGTTVRTFAPALGGWVVHWSMAGLPGYTYLEEQVVEGALVGEGHGLDGEGQFVERYRYSGISDTTYTFEMERSYDDGNTWRPYANLRATRPRGACVSGCNETPGIDIEVVRTYLIDALERNRDQDLAFLAVAPDSMLRWAPTPQVRDFTQQIAHATHDFFRPWRDTAPTASDTTRYLNDKTALAGEIADAYEWALTEVRSRPISALVEMRELPNGAPAPTWRVMQYWLDHAVLTRASTIPYLRLHGVSPPAAKFW